MARDDDAFKLAASFPEEMSVVGKVRNNEAYFEELKAKWESKFGKCSIPDDCNPRRKEA